MFFVVPLAANEADDREGNAEMAIAKIDDIVNLIERKDEPSIVNCAQPTKLKYNNDVLKGRVIFEYTRIRRGGEERLD